MSVRKFCLLLHESKVAKNDLVWFPRWLRRYESLVEMTPTGLPVTEAEVIRFLRTLRDNGTPAWQRLQALRAVEMYRNLVLKTDQPALHEIRRTLARLADRERTSAGSTAGGRDALGRQRVGTIDSAEPPIVQQTRSELRLRHKALDTEKAYVG